MSCPVHDWERVWQECSCTSERKWARKKMLQELLEEIASKTTLDKEKK